MGNPVDIDAYYSKKENSAAQESPKAYSKDVLREPSFKSTHPPKLPSLNISSPRPPESRSKEKDEPKRGEKERYPHPPSRTPSTSRTPSSSGYSEQRGYDNRPREKERLRTPSPIREKEQESRHERERSRSPVSRYEGKRDRSYGHERHPEKERPPIREREHEKRSKSGREREHDPRYELPREPERGESHGIKRPREEAFPYPKEEDERRREKRKEEERKSKSSKQGGGETGPEDELRYKRRGEPPDDGPSGLSRQRYSQRPSTSYSGSESRKDKRSSSTSQQGQTQGGYTKKESFSAQELSPREKPKEPLSPNIADSYNSSLGKRKNWDRSEFTEQHAAQLESSSAKKHPDQPAPEQKKSVEPSKEDVPREKQNTGFQRRF